MKINLLNREFYERETVLVAREMIGKRLVRIIRIDCKIIKLTGIIVETEAYGYEDDKASHAYNGITGRNKFMFGRGGFSYVYFTYGNHYCFNVTAHIDTKCAGAVLIRAIEPLTGIRQMIKNRGNKNRLNLTSGPGKLTQAFYIDIKDNGMDITNSNSSIFIEDSLMSDVVLSTKRIGILNDKDKYWRFIYAKKSGENFIINKYVSRKKENLNYMYNNL